MNSNPIDLPPAYTELPTEETPLDLRADQAVTAIRYVSQFVIGISRNLKSNITAYSKLKDAQHQKTAREDILMDFNTLINEVKALVFHHGLKDINAEIITNGFTRRKLKLCQRAMECLEAGLQEHFTEMKKVGIFKESEERETEEALVGECGVDMERDYKIGGKIVEYLKSLKIALVG